MSEERTEVAEVERQIAEIWADVLRLDQVAVGDSFVRLGGRSLMAIQVTNRLRDSLGVEIEPHLIFELATPAALAEHIATLNWLANDKDSTSAGEEWEF